MTELMFSILFFIISSAICVQCFATAISKSRDAKELTGAINVASNAAEEYLASEITKGFTEYYNDNWEEVADNSEGKFKATAIITEPEKKGECQTLHVVVSNMKDEEIYSLVVEKALK